MTEFELDALWTWGVTKAEIRAKQLDASRQAERERDAAIIADYRRRHREATARPPIILLLAEMEAQAGGA